MSIWSPILAKLLPQDCLLCGARSGADLLCAACREELPGLPEPACPVCAEASPGGMVCGACLKTPPHFDVTFAPFRYAFPVDKLIQSLKYQHRLATADFLASAMLAGPRPAGDLIVPLPLSVPRLRQRGFNQAVEIARLLARTIGLPLQLYGCTRSRDTVPQATLPWKERHKNVRHAFECAVDLSGKSVIVVDDVMTTGATLNEFAGTLKAHGAARVTNWVAARTLRD
ncbi:MAG TPA: ComF family protein [Rhodocyclaceae bacterium]|nr:ComF family protein [Rhodocyclaceae bacterium]